MKNLDKTNPFKSKTVKTDLGTITTLITDYGISEHGSINFENKTLLANYIYTQDKTYNLVYSVIENDGTHENFVEDDGILPTLFLNPNNEVYVSVVPYHPDKEVEISVPVFNRENTELPKGNRPFTGKFVGVSNQYSIFYDVDIWSDKKPDKLLAIEFKNESIRKKHNVKIPMPRNNKIFINDNEIHLLSKEGNLWLHRLIDERGNVLKERKIKPNQKWPDQILSISFEDNSYILCRKEGKFSIEIIPAQGNCEITNLIDIKDEIFNTWEPEKIAKNTFIVRFNNEFGNGWLTLKNDKLLEIFFSKGEKGYKNLLTNEVLQIDNENLVISSINKTVDYGYAVIFYPQTDRDTKNKELIILNREIKNEK